MIGTLPRQLTVNKRQYRIRTDFRDVLKIVCAFNDPELEDAEKVYVCLYILYMDFEEIPEEDFEAAFQAATAFIDHGTRTDGEQAKPPLRVMDWEQDESILFPAINKAAGFEVRTARYVHWWTFLGYYMEISEGVFANVLSLRLKKARGKKLEKWEREYWNSNKSVCVLQTKLSAVEQAEKDRLNLLLG